MTRLYSLAMLAVAAVAMPTAQERAKVKAWDDLAVQWGYDYEMYQVPTADDWILTMFRITGNHNIVRSENPMTPVSDAATQLKSSSSKKSSSKSSTSKSSSKSSKKKKKDDTDSDSDDDVVVIKHSSRTTVYYRADGTPYPEGYIPPPSPILLQHGGLQDAADWVGGQTGLTPMPFQLFDQGYDVWMGNQRGTRYSLDMVNNKYPFAEDTSYGRQHYEDNRDKYDYSFPEMGKYDLPAMIETMRQVTNQPKVTYIGYSIGTTQMIHALTQQEETYFSDRVEKCILLAPCVLTSSVGYDDYKSIFDGFYQNAIWTVSDDNWRKQTDGICRNPDKELTCEFAKTIPEGGQQMSTKTFDHMMQIAVEQEFIEFGDDYRKTATNRTVTPVTPGMNSIDKVPIQYIAAQNDTVCLSSDARDLNTTIPSSQKYTEIPDASHEYFAFYANTPEFMQILTNEIEWTKPVPYTPSGASNVYLSATLAAIASLAALF